MTRSRQNRRRFLFAAVLMACALTLTACGKKSTVKSLAVQPDASAAASVGAQPLSGQVDSFMTDQLRIFIQQKGRLPQNFTELVRSRMSSVPHPPDGMEWVIDRNTQEIKLVKSK